MTVDESKFRISVLEPNALPFAHDDLKSHALVVRELVGSDVIAKHLRNLGKGLVGSGGF
jgi:hypothetical protein